MIIDFHTHIFPDTICNGRDRYCSLDAAFNLLYESPKSKIVGADDLVKTMDQEGVDISVVFGFPWSDEAMVKEGNDYVIEAVHRYPDRLRGFACFDMALKGVPEETQRCIDAGLSGVGELAFYLSGIDDQALDHLEPVMEICRLNENLPVMIHTNEPVGHYYPGKTPVTLEQIYRLAKRFPDNRIVLAHWGGGILFYSLLKRKVKSVLKNIWYDTAASPFLYDPAIYSTAMGFDISDKIVFGSDYPLLKPGRYFAEIDQSGISSEKRAKILGLNAATLLKDLSKETLD